MIFNLLKQIFKGYDVVREWDVARDSQDGFTRELYCPRVDFAVGPFNLDANIDYNNRLIEEAYQKYKSLLELLKSRSDSKDKVLKPNENPRCFLVIEIEHKSSRKHRLGSIVNASALGKIGIIVASDQKVFESLVKIRKYLEFLDHVQKTRCAPENIMIITKENFLEILRGA
ncbi:MAG: hypothetical protein ACPLSA_05470 [Caldanaerobacter sp.]